jgi:hypothetical protein
LLFNKLLGKLQIITFICLFLKSSGLIILLFVFLLVHGCILNYVPTNIREDEELFVVEGLITDQPGINTIKLSKSLPLWGRQFNQPVKRCIVWISDDLGQIHSLKETTDGTYVTDQAGFRGAAGRKYSLHIRTTADSVNFSYESSPVEMKPVPPIDSIYYEKRRFEQWPQYVEGCNIYLDTHDPASNCKFFRWEYTETWEFHLPFNVPNRVCWLSNNSNGIIIKNASFIEGSSVVRHPIINIKNPIDRLSVKYSLLVNQFSLNDDEYLYWERLKNTIELAGGLYDLIPATIPNNIYCLEDPGKKVLGYFSVSAVSSKRIFIKDTFTGYDVQYVNCVTDTIFGTDPIPGLNTSVWVLIDRSDRVPPKRYITTKKECADCTTRGTNIKPVFWIDDK